MAHGHIGAGGDNRQITFEVSKDQVTWNTINTPTTSASGDASYFYRPSDNRYYRARFAGSADLGAGSSPLVRVVVRSLIFLRPTGCPASSPCRVSRNQRSPSLRLPDPTGRSCRSSRFSTRSSASPAPPGSRSRPGS